MRLQAHGDAVEPGHGAEQGPGVDVVGEQPAGGGEDSGAEVAGGQLSQLAGQDGQSEWGQIRAEQGDTVALQKRADGVQTSLHPTGDRL